MCADDLFSRCDLVRNLPCVCGLGWGVSPQKRATLLKVESAVCFQRKRGLPSSRLTKAGQVRVAVF